MTTKKILLSSIAAATLITSVYAQEKELDSVDVWDTEVVSSSLDMDGTAIETKQADHLSDLLSSLPGVDIGGTHSINNRLNIRSLQDEDLDITIDGAKIQNVNMFHHIGNLLINPDILKKVEIGVGSNSVVNGSLGGSVNFETKDGEDLLDKGQEYGARVQANYNSNKSTGASVAGYGKVNETDDFLIYHNQVKKGNVKNGKGVEKFGGEGDVSNTLVKFGHKTSDTEKIILSYDKVRDKGDYTPRPDFGVEYNMARTGTQTFPTVYERDTISLKHELRLDDTKVDTTLYNNTNELERYETWTSAFIRGSKEGNLIGEVKTSGVNIKAQTNHESGGILNTFTYGGFVDTQSSKVTWNGDKYGDDEKARTRVIFLEDAMDFDNGFILTPGIRHTKYTLDGSYGTFSDSKTTYALASEYAATDDLTLLASATTLYKGVEMVDVLASNRRFVADNNNLQAETGINKEAGFKYIKNNALGADTTGILFKYFNTQIDNYISQSWKAMSNEGTLEIKGFEASFAYVKGDLNTLLTYARSDSKFEKTGLPLVKDPGDTVSFTADYKVLPNLAISWETLHQKEETDTAGSAYNVKKSYTVHDIAMNYKPQSVKNLTVIAGIDNIFDKEYTSHISENRSFTLSDGNTYSTADLEPGRNIKVSLAYKF